MFLIPNAYLHHGSKNIGTIDTCCSSFAIGNSPGPFDLVFVIVEEDRHNRVSPLFIFLQLLLAYTTYVS